MKPIESIIAAYLADYAALKAIHGGHCQQGLANQKWIAPYQSIFLISDPPDMKRLGRPRPRLQIDSFSLKYGETRLMGELTYEALDGFSGVLDGVTIEMGAYQDIQIVYESDTKLWKAQTDVTILYRM
jgi:hypothetical protein